MAAEELALGETTIRQHLDRLVKEGLLSVESVAEGRGRPTLHFRLTARGQQLLPSQNGKMFGRLLKHLVREGHLALVEQFFRSEWSERRREIVARLRESRASSFAERLDVLEAFLADEGFVPEIEIDDGTVTLRQCNCPLSEAVDSTRLPCRLEAALLQELLDRPLTRVSYIPDGHPVCSYSFSSREDVDER